MISTLSDKTLSQLIKDADAVFSKYIRYRDRHKAHSFRIDCFICGKSERVEYSQAMHYIDRDQMAVRYDEMNVHAGCEHCNCFDLMHTERYHAAMIEKYGAEKVAELELKARSLAKFTRHELLELIDTYKHKLKELRWKVTTTK